ncbi:tyrosine-type recombinase/integrase [Paenibacillus sp. strain BS8-2]
MASIQQRGKYSWRLVIPLGYNANGKKRTPARKPCLITDTSLMQSIDKLDEFDHSVLKSTKSLNDFLKNCTDANLLRHAKKLQKFFDEHLYKFKSEIEDGDTYKKQKRFSFKAFGDFWNENHLPTLEFTTRNSYKYHYETRILPCFESMYLDEITTTHIVKFMTDLRNPETKFGKRRNGKSGPLKSASLVFVYRVMRSIFSKAVQWKKLDENPMEGVNKPAEDDVKKPDAYNEEELIQLYEALEHDVNFDPRYKEPRYRMERMILQVLVTLDTTTGMRRAELLGQKRSNLKFHYDPESDIWSCTGTVLETIPAFKNGEPVIKLPKNNEPRSMAYSPSIAYMLLEYCKVLEKHLRAAQGRENVISNEEEDYYLFPNLATGKPLHPSTIRKKWVTFHDRHPHLRYIPFHGIRHTATSIMIAKNVHNQAIAKRLGWKNAKMVDRYSKIFASVDAASAAVFEDILPAKLKQRE